MTWWPGAWQKAGKSCPSSPHIHFSRTVLCLLGDLSTSTFVCMEKTRFDSHFSSESLINIGMECSAPRKRSYND